MQRILERSMTHHRSTSQMIGCVLIACPTGGCGGTIRFDDVFVGYDYGYRNGGVTCYNDNKECHPFDHQRNMATKSRMCSECGILARPTRETVYMLLSYARSYLAKEVP